MPRLYVWTLLSFVTCFPCSGRADDEADSAPLPLAAKRVLEDAEKAVAKNRRTFEAANNASLDEAEKALKAVMESLTKDGKLEEALATKKLLTKFREQIAGTADGSPKPKPTDDAKRKPAPKAPPRGGKAQFNEQFGFTDEKRVKEFWDFDDRAKNHQLGTDGIRLNDGGTMTMRTGLIGDFEIAVAVRQHTGWRPSVLRIAGATIDIGNNDRGEFRLFVARKGNQLLVSQNRKQSMLTVPEDQVDSPHYPAISCGAKCDVMGVAIKAMTVQRPEE